MSLPSKCPQNQQQKRDTHTSLSSQASTSARSTPTSELSSDFSEPKFETRGNRAQGHLPPLPTQNARSTNESNSLKSATSSSGKVNSSGSSFKKHSSEAQYRSALERAIEEGDWEAVGEAAAMMGDASVSSVGTSELGSLDDSTLSSSKPSKGSSSRFSSSNSGANGVRAVELDKLIDKGDWSGVVAAASRFKSADTTKKSGAKGIFGENRGFSSASPMRLKKTDHFNKGVESRSSNTDGWKGRFFGGKSSTGSSSNNASNDSHDGKKKSIQEEQDALAQAEIWMAIAAQSKNEGSSGKLFFAKLYICIYPAQYHHTHHFKIFYSWLDLHSC